jgi:hypothetical protein
MPEKQALSACLVARMKFGITKVPFLGFLSLEEERKQ